MQSGIKIRDIYEKISNKTIRAYEPKLKRWKTQNNGTLVETNRGFFLDGHNISAFSASAWLARHKDEAKFRKQKPKKKYIAA